MERVKGVQGTVQAEEAQAETIEGVIFNPQSLETKSDANNVDVENLVNVPFD